MPLDDRNSVSIVLVEDDFFQYTDIKARLEAEFGDEVRVITDESEFIEALPSLAESSPDVFVIDVMLPWHNLDRLTDSVEISECPPDRTDVHVAGIRLEQDIRANPVLRNAITVLFSVLDRTDLPPDTVFVSKGQDIIQLVKHIRRVLVQRGGQRK